MIQTELRRVNINHDLGDNDSTGTLLNLTIPCCGYLGGHGLDI